MAKTLVIKGANFSANKVDTVNFDRIHTTDIELTESTLSLSAAVGTKETLKNGRVVPTVAKYGSTPITTADIGPWI